MPSPACVSLPLVSILSSGFSVGYTRLSCRTPAYSPLPVHVLDTGVGYVDTDAYNAADSVRWTRGVNSVAAADSYFMTRDRNAAYLAARDA